MPMERINIFLFAAHHTADNIASQRFKGLLKYLDKNKYRIYVFSRIASNHVSSVAGGNIHVFEMLGNCVGEEKSFASLIVNIISIFSTRLSSKISKLFKNTEYFWLLTVLAQAHEVVEKHLSAGEKCIAVGTYSPIDALIAATSFAKVHSLPCILDFRDGLAFESLGRRGLLPDSIKIILESHLIKSANLITTVSRPLVEYFTRSYPGAKIQLLPNGYDPTDFEVCLEADAENVIQSLKDKLPQDKIIIGHFGRIGASDASRMVAFRHFLEIMVKLDAYTQNYHLLFVGELTDIESSLLASTRLSVSNPGQVKRSVALQMMRLCHHLILLTGTHSSTATGKIYEYLATGVPVICVSGIENAASEILSETGMGQTIIVGDVEINTSKLREIMATPAQRDPNIDSYSKKNQANALSLSILELLNK